MPHPRKRSIDAISKRLNTFATVKRIRSGFPFYAITKMISKASGKSSSGGNLTNGFVAYAIVTPGIIQDPFGDLELTGIDGATDTDSLFESAGKVAMQNIYSVFRVISSTFSIRIWDIDPTIIDIAAHNITNNLMATATVAATTTTEQFNTPLECYIIPSSTSTVPIATWNDIVHHPFAFKVTIPNWFKQNGKKSKWLKIDIPNHVKFMMQMTPTSDAEVLTNFNAFDITSLVQSPQLHIFFVDKFHQSDATHAFAYEVKLSQEVLMGKQTTNTESMAVQAETDLILAQQ